MLAPRYRRLWKRRLRRRPLLPFLLAAAAAVDAALPYVEFDSPLVSSILAAQLGLLGVWITSARRGAVPRASVALLIVVAGLAISGNLAMGSSENRQVGPLSVDYVGITTAVILASFGAMTAGAGLAQWAARRFRDGRLPARRRRFRIDALLWITSLTAMLIAFGLAADWAILTESIVLGVISTEAVGVMLLVFFATAFRPSVVKWLLLFWTPAIVAAVGWYVEAPHLLIYAATHAAILSGTLLALEPNQRRANESSSGTPAKAPKVVPVNESESPESIDLRG